MANRFALVAAYILGLLATTAHAEEFRYHYISLTRVQLPSMFVEFDPAAINDSGRVYGTVWDASFVDPHVAVYANGAVTIFRRGAAVAVNARGTIGGHITRDPETFEKQAALFRGRNVKIIPFLRGETNTSVVSLNDFDTALVRSEDPSVLNTYRLYDHGKTTFRFQLPTGSDCSSCWGVNNQGIVAGTIFDANLNAFRAIRFRPPYGEPVLLDPLPRDNDSTSTDINNSGYVLGISNNVFGDPTKNRYGVWDRKGNFKTYFEGITYDALFNDKNLIVLTGNFDTDFNSYLVPRPGVRLNVEDLVDNPTSVEAPLALVVDINNHGDMVGYGLCDDSGCHPFLLRRESPGRDGEDEIQSQ